MSENKEINLILQGGGVKGLAYIGALRCLEENGYKVKNIAGSSIGAVIGSLIIAGYNSYELEEIINQIDYKMFMRKNSFSEFIKTKGLFSTKHLESFLNNLLLNKNIQYFKDIKVGNYYKAMFVCTSLKNKRIFVLPYDLKYLNINPDTFPIAKAVIMSCSIPLFYESYKLNHNYFFDGGISDNFPVWCFKKAIALRVSNENKIFEFIKKQIFGKINNPNNIKEIYINIKGYSATDFKKGFENKNYLYKLGYYSVNDLLNKPYVSN